MCGPGATRRCAWRSIRNHALAGLLAGSALAAVLAGCMEARPAGPEMAGPGFPPPPPPPPLPPDEEPAPEPPFATTAYRSVEVAILTRHDLDRLADVMQRAAPGRPDALHLAIRVRLRSVAAAVLRVAARFGVDRGKIRFLAEPVRNPAALAEVIVIRWLALAPACPPPETYGPSFLENDFSPDLGCPTAGNLAVMLNDPAVLAGNHAFAPADGARATVAIERYRSAPQTVGNASIAPSGSDGASSGSAITAPGTASAAILGSGVR